MKLGFGVMVIFVLSVVFAAAPLESQEDRADSLLDLVAKSEVTFRDIKLTSSQALNAYSKLRTPQLQFAGDLWTPLTLSIRTRQYVVASLLIAVGADVNATTRAGYSPLWLLASDAHSPEQILVAEALLDRGADARLVPRITIDGPFGENALHCAVRRANVQLFAAIVNTCPDANVASMNGEFPIDLVSAKELTMPPTKELIQIRTILSGDQ